MSAQPSPSRIEAFSDGVIAVIITIMVLEFKLPRDAGFAGFRTILPQLAVYAISFSFTGIYWINHHHLVDRLHRIDALILWANLGFLFCLSLLPFFTNYLVDKRVDSFSVAVYAFSLFVTGVAFSLLDAAIARHLRLSPGPPAQHPSPAGVNQPGKTAISILLYLVAIPLSFWHPHLALADVAFVTVLWIVPDFSSEAQPPA